MPFRSEVAPWIEVPSPATLEELRRAGVLGDHFGDVADQLPRVGLGPEDRVFWRVDLPLVLVSHWRSFPRWWLVREDRWSDDPDEDAYIDALAAAWNSSDPPPPVVLTVHPPDRYGQTFTGLDGHRRVPAAVRAGLRVIPCWLVPLDRPHYVAPVTLRQHLKALPGATRQLRGHLRELPRATRASLRFRLAQRRNTLPRR